MNCAPQDCSPRSHGFTLIELMIVVAIIGILSAIAIPKFADLVRKSHEARIKGNLASLRSALSIYYGANEGFYPVGPDTYSSNATYLRPALVPTYIKEIPTTNLSPYHQRQTTFDSYISTTASENDTSCDGEWAYVGRRRDIAWGHIFVECWHTDTKNQPINEW
jgi:general secretion pathway protein G